MHTRLLANFTCVSFVLLCVSVVITSLNEKKGRRLTHTELCYSVEMASV